jgi:hypothetical protein
VFYFSGKDYTKFTLISGLSSWGYMFGSNFGTQADAKYFGATFALPSYFTDSTLNRSYLPQIKLV